MDYKKIAKIALVCQSKKRIINSLYRIVEGMDYNPNVQEILDEEIQKVLHDLEIEKRKLLKIIGK